MNTRGIGNFVEMCICSGQRNNRKKILKTSINFVRSVCLCTDPELRCIQIESAVDYVNVLLSEYIGEKYKVNISDI